MILLDIEGTTTPLAFVTGTLFPYARVHLQPWLQRHGREPQAAAAIARLKSEHQAEREPGVPPWSAESYALWLMDRDRKSPALKDLQGQIWADGYASREFVGTVFEDVPRAFARWWAAGRRMGIFSSGSVLAQRLLFRHSSAGDLTPYLQWHFDTAIGAKRDPPSYARIASAIGAPASAITFLSDLAVELDAASAAGMETILSMRPGNAPQPPHRHRVVRSFDEL